MDHVPQQLVDRVHVSVWFMGWHTVVRFSSVDLSLAFVRREWKYFPCLIFNIADGPIPTDTLLATPFASFLFFFSPPPLRNSCPSLLLNRVVEISVTIHPNVQKTINQVS